LVVDTSLNKLTFNEQSVIVEGRLMGVLVYLSEQSGETVSIDELIQRVWEGQVVSNSAVYRVVAELRKVLVQKLESDALITTVTKKGYRLEANISLISDSKQSELTTNKTAMSVKYSVVTLLLLVVTVLIIWQLSKKPVYESATESNQSSLKVTPVTSLQGKELFPIISPEGQYLLFSHSPLKSDYFNLFIQVIDDSAVGQNTTFPGQRKTIQLTNEKAILLSAGWSPDGQTIVYQRIENNQCNIMLADFDSNKLAVVNHRIFTNCRESLRSPISWSLDGQRIYYVSSLSGKNEVFEHHISTQEKSRIARPDDNFAWNYFAISSPFEDKVLILSVNNYKYTYFTLYDVKEQSQQLIHIENSLIDSVAWGESKNELIFEEKDKRLIILDITTSKRVKLFESGTFLGSVSRGHNGKYFIYGNQLQANEEILVGTLTEADTVSEVTPLEWQLNSSLIEKAPEFANLTNNIAFVSNRTGVNQLWLRTTEGQLSQLTAFTSDDWFGRLRWSPDDNKILFARGGSVYIFEMATNETKKVIGFEENDFKVAYVPNWSSDGNEVFYSLYQNGENYVWSQDISKPSQNPEKITDIHSRNLQSSADGRYLYYTAMEEYGLFQYDTETEVIINILPDLHPNHWNSWRVTNSGIYYLNSKADTSAVYFYDLESEETSLVFPWKIVYGNTFSISSDGKFYARDLYVDHESDIMMISDYKD